MVTGVDDEIISFSKGVQTTHWTFISFRDAAESHELSTLEELT